MKTITGELTAVWVVHEVATEYGTLGPLVGVFRDKEMANAAGKGKGWWGGEGSIKPAKGLVVGSEVYVISEPSPVEIDTNLPEIKAAAIAAAKNKLTPTERHLLGIKD